MELGRLQKLKDNYGRTIDYIRISITDRCNLRCKYCMPDGISFLPVKEILTLEEIVEVCKIGVELGICKVKITGGEPLVRRDCVKLVRMIKAIPNIEQVTLTTNGVLLKQYAKELYESGIDGINVSLDTLDREKYCEITGFDKLSDVLEGIKEVQKYNIPLKINAVLRKDAKEEDYLQLVELAKNQTINVRFIEMMPIGYGKHMETISGNELLALLEKTYGTIEKDEKVHGNGPAIYYRLPKFLGSIGFINAIHGKFCKRCNRVRLTSTGFLKGCLCYGTGVSIKEDLRSGNYDKVKQLLENIILEKPKEHIFEQWEEITEQNEMVRIGG